MIGRKEAWELLNSTEPKDRLKALTILGDCWHIGIYDKSTHIQLISIEKTGRWIEATDHPNWKIRREAFIRTRMWEKALKDSDTRIQKIAAKILGLTVRNLEKEKEFNKYFKNKKGERVWK